MFLTPPNNDSGVNTFSSDGRLYQVEYAIKAAKIGPTAIGICTSEGVVLAAEKRIISPLMEAPSIQNIFEIDKHITCAVSGLIADSRPMINRARLECQKHWFVYNERMSVRSAIEALSNFTVQFGDEVGKRSRPFAVAILFAGIDEKGPQLFHMNPSGTIEQFDAKAIGSGIEGAQHSLQEVYHKSMTLKDALKAGLMILKHEMEEKHNAVNMEVITMTPEKMFYKFKTDEVAEILSQLNKITEGVPKTDPVPVTPHQIPEPVLVYVTAENPNEMETETENEETKNE